MVYDLMGLSRRSSRIKEIGRDSSKMLEKAIWTNEDFEVMGWHDATLYSFLMLPDSFEVTFDIDYITQRVQSQESENQCSLWVAPATLVFKPVFNFSVQIEIDVNQELEILDLNRQPNGDKGNFKWSLELQVGMIEFEAAGYTQYFRSVPMLGKSQSSGLEKRGGVSFARKTFTDK